MYPRIKLGMEFISLITFTEDKNEKESGQKGKTVRLPQSALHVKGCTLLVWWGFQLMKRFLETFISLRQLNLKRPSLERRIHDYKLGVSNCVKAAQVFGKLLFLHLDARKTNLTIILVVMYSFIVLMHNKWLFIHILVY